MTPLRVVMLSYERGFLNATSEASVRLGKLSANSDRLSAIVLSNTKDAIDERVNHRVIGINGSGPMRFWKALRAALREVTRARKAGEHAILSAQDPFIAGNIAFWVSRIADVPFEVQEHADYFSGAWERELPVVRKMFAWSGKYILRRADVVRTVSDRIRDRLVRLGVQSDRIHVTPVAQQVTALLSRSSRAWPETPTIVVPCRFVKQKGLDILLKSLALLSAEGLAFRLRLIGEGALGPKLADLASKLGIRDRVEFEQWSTQEEIWNDADLFVMSSRYEGWGRTIVEAMAAGVPIVTTDVGCVGSFFRPQVDGRVAQSDAVVGLAAAIREQLTETERREWMVQNARARAREFPSAEELIKQQHEWWLSVFGSQPSVRDKRPTADSRQPKAFNRRAWLSTSLVMSFVILVHALSVILFWKSLASHVEWGFMHLVEHWFQGFGYSFASELGCASAYRSPGYLFFLTAVYGIFGFQNYLAQAIIQNITAVLVAYLVYRLGWFVAKDRRVGLIGAVLVTVSPYTFYHYTQFYHTQLSALFLVGTILSVAKLGRSRKLKWAAVSGVLIACLAYIQGTILPVTPFLALWVFIQWWPNWKQAVKAVAIMAVASMLLIAPWTYRNWTVFHRFVPLTTDLGHALFKANNEVIYELTKRGYPQEIVDNVVVSPDRPGYEQYRLPPALEQEFAADGVLRPSIYWTEWHPRPPTANVSTCAELGPLHEPAFNDYWNAKSKTWIAENWTNEGWRLQLLKAKTFWQPSLFPSVKTGAQWPFADQKVLVWLANTSLTTYASLIIFGGLIGLGLTLMRKKREGWLVLAVLAVYTLMHTFFAGYTKYRIPLDNVLAVYAAWLCVMGYDTLRKRGLDQDRLDHE